MTMLFRRHRQQFGGASALAFAFFAGDAVAAPTLGSAGTFARAGTATYWDTNGVVQTATSGTIRNGHFLSGVKHFLFEGAKTNSALQSQDLTQAAWTKSLCTVGGSVTTPDGTAAVTTTGIIGSNATNTLIDGTLNIVCAAGYTVTASTAQALSVFVKSGNKSNLIIQNRISDGATFHTSWVNTTTGVIGTKSANHTIKVWALSNGWFRVEVRETSSGAGATANLFSFGFVDADNSHTLTGDGATVNGYCWGMQYEIDKPWPSSYISTGASTVSRIADTLTFPHNSTPQSRTLFVDFTELGANFADGGGLTVFQIGAVNDFQYLTGWTSGTMASLAANGGVASNALTDTEVGITVGARVEWRSALSTAPITTVGNSVNSGIESTVTSGATAGPFGTTYGGPNYVLTLNGGNSQQIAVRAFKDFTGAQSLATMRGAAQPSQLVFKYTAGDSLAAWTTARAGTATYYDVNGVVQTASTGVMRDGHYLGGVRHWLLEPARTNSVLWSQDLTNVSWGKNLCTIGGSVTTPDGATGQTTNGVIGASGANAAQVVSNGLAATASTNQAWSFFAKPGNKSNFATRITLLDGSSLFAWFNASTGVVGTVQAGLTVKLWPCTNGWYRCEVRCNSSLTGASTPQITFAPVDADNTTSLTGDGVTVNGYVWGAQFEQDQPWPTSYVPTTTASVSRVVDSNATIPHNSVPQSRTLYANMTYISFGTTYNNGSMWTIGLGGAGVENHQLTIDLGPALKARTVCSGTLVTGSLSMGTPNTGDQVEMRVSCAPSSPTAESQGFALNGAAETTGGGAAHTAPFAPAYSVANYQLSCAAFPLAIRSVKDALGLQTLATMRSL